ncbi:aspartic proteinase precursor [Obba rivulosa]|uniref:Aspartic proteinase n=1 Tax=Obba rivulosa TaxID=1052685 RepID=A0A8E2DKK7_9APHY|nr:aspartic proteinase precursor [Obba rivulosa]
MFPAVTLVLFCALAVVAKPVVVRDSPITLPVVRRLNLTGKSTIADLDRARVRSMQNGVFSRPARAKSAASVFNVPVTNEAVSYVATVGVGSPATDYSLIVDTGSSNTWVGAGKGFVESSTTKSTGQEVSVTYGSGFFLGEQFTDTVTIGSLSIPNQGIGAAIFSEGFDGVDGILGIGPVDLTEDTLFPDEDSTIPTVTDNAFSQGLISAHEVGISFEPTTSDTSTNGELTFGGTDSSKFTGSITFVPLTTTSPANEFVGIDQSITLGSAGTSILTSTAGIVDTGTTLLLIATDALSRYVDAVGASSEADEETGLFTISAENFANLQSLFFNIGGTSFEFTPNAQIWPRALNTDIGGNADTIYLVTGDIGSDTGSGLDFINGMVWLERFFFVFNAGSSEAGFATTSFTDATTN